MLYSIILLRYALLTRGRCDAGAGCSGTVCSSGGLCHPPSRAAGLQPSTHVSQVLLCSHGAMAPSRNARGGGGGVCCRRAVPCSPAATSSSPSSSRHSTAPRHGCKGAAARMAQRRRPPSRPPAARCCCTLLRVRVWGDSRTRRCVCACFLKTHPSKEFNYFSLSLSYGL